MVNTIKFSQFNQGNLSDTTDMVVGFGSGANLKVPLILTWTTATRPATPYNGLLGYNTDLDQWEFFNSTLMIWIQLLDSLSGFNWTEITASSVTAVVNNGYVTNRSATPVNITLPSIFSIGDSVHVMNIGAAGWSLVANTGHTIIFGNQTSSVDGSISSTLQSDSVVVRGLVANTTWNVVSAVGNLTVA